MLTTCPSAMKKFTQKLNLNKDVTNLDELIDQQTHHSASIAFSATFVKYYFGLFIYLCNTINIMVELT